MVTLTQVEAIRSGINVSRLSFSLSFASFNSLANKCRFQRGRQSNPEEILMMHNCFNDAIEQQQQAEEVLVRSLFISYLLDAEEQLCVRERAENQINLFF